MKYKIPIIEKTLESIISGDALTILLFELNAIVGSSITTCVEGG